jgi:hypothetical protein
MTNEQKIIATKLGLLKVAETLLGHLSKPLSFFLTRSQLRGTCLLFNAAKEVALSSAA